MAAIEKRTTKDGETTFRVKVRLKGFPAQTATFSRLTDAKRWAQQTEAAIREGRYFKTTEAKRHTLGDLVDRYKRDVLPGKPKSQRTQAVQIQWWKDQIGAYTLADVTPALIAEHRDKLAREPLNEQPADSLRFRTPATVNRYLAVLSHAFAVAVKEWGWLEHNPVMRVTKPKEPRGRVRFLSDKERQALLQACHESASSDLYTAVVLALSTGARRMEIMGLRWPQVDLHRRVITLHETKNGEIRAVPVVGPAYELLRERQKVRRIDTDLVFPGSTAPSPRPVDLRTPWETALKRAKIEDFRWHDLRHTCASYLAMNGATLAEIAEVLGHKTLAMVKRYAHLSEAHTAGVLERMAGKMFG